MALPVNKLPDYTFPKSARLLQRHEFVCMSQTGVKYAARHFIVLVGNKRPEGTRIGITVSRKVGCAVVRNRLKRLLREFYRLHREQFPLADLVIISRSSAANCSVADLHKDLVSVMLRVLRT